MKYRVSSLYLANPVVSLYEGEGEGVTATVAAPTTPTTPTTPTGAGVSGGADPNATVNVDPNTRFNQDQLNTIIQDRLAKDRKKHEEKYKALETTYQDLLANEAVSEGAKDDLKIQLEDLRKQHRTKEEQAKHEKNQLKDSYEGQLQQYKDAAVHWESEHKSNLIEVALMNAAVAHDAFMPSQVLSIVREWTKLVDVLDENEKPTGKLTAMVDLPDVDADTGKAIVTQSAPMEAIERMKQLQPNLFKANVVSGVGGNSTTGGGTPGADGQIDLAALTPEQFMKLRKEDPTKLGLRSNQRR